MENTNESGSGQENSPAEMQDSLPGSMLREARERLGMSIMDVSSQIKFAPRQIEALEANDFEHLPELAFLRGFVRSYAKVLQLDAEPLLAALPQKRTPAELSPEPVKEPRPDVHSALQQNSTWLGGALVVIVIAVGFALWHLRSPSEPVKVAEVEAPVALPAAMPASSVQAASEPAAVEPEVPPAPPAKTAPHKMEAQKAQPAKNQAAKTQPAKEKASASGVPETGVAPARPAKKKQAIPGEMPAGASGPVATVRLEFSEDSWAEIKDKDGKILSSRAHPAGSELTVRGQPPLSVLIGNAPTVRVFYREKEVDLTRHTRRSTGVASLTLE